MAKLVTVHTKGRAGFDTEAYGVGRIFSYDLTSPPSPTFLRLFDDADNDIVFTGTGITGNIFTGFAAGTITSITLRDGGKTEFTATGLNMSAKEFYEFAKADMTQRLWKIGLAGNDVILGTGTADLLNGYAGNDKISGSAGQDKLFGGNGNDTLKGGLSGDILNGGAGSDTADYSDSNAAVTVNLSVKGESRGGTASGDFLSLIENLTGSLAGNDMLTGDKGANLLRGLGGKDTLTGNAGSDYLEGGAGADILKGGTGNDTASYATSNAKVSVDLRKTSTQTDGHAAGDKLSGMENLIGSKFDDTLTGTDGNNVITGGKGADVLKGLGGTDTVSYAGSSKGVQVDLHKSAQTSVGDAKGDVLSGFENIIGSAFADTLTGTSGDNTFTGGRGGDAFRGGSGTDTVSYAGSSKGVNVSLGSASPAFFTGDAVDDTFSSIENLTGSSRDDFLIGNDNANVLSGGIGDDKLAGGKGNDVMIGAAGNDEFQYTYENFDSNFDGKDVIRGFIAGAGSGDHIAFLTDKIPNTFAGAMSIATQVGNNTVFTFDASNTLTLLNVQKSALISDDIDFFGLG
jgi:Ca2+-binding RTX toxin-like protein